MRTSTDRFMSGFQRGNRLLSGDTRKRIEELLEAVVPLEKVDQVAERYPGTNEYGCAPEDVRVAMNNRYDVWHIRSLPTDSSSTLAR